MQQGYKYTTVGQLKIYNRVLRNSFLLPRDQQVTLLFILDRTVGWRKPFETISMSEFENGVVRGKGKVRRLVAPGTGLSPERVALALRALNEGRAIGVDQVQSKTWYGINEDWRHPDFSPAADWQGWTINESDYIYSND